MLYGCAAIAFLFHPVELRLLCILNEVAPRAPKELGGLTFDHTIKDLFKFPFFTVFWIPLFHREWVFFLYYLEVIEQLLESNINAHLGLSVSFCRAKVPVIFIVLLKSSVFMFTCSHGSNVGETSGILLRHRDNLSSVNRLEIEERILTFSWIIFLFILFLRFGRLQRLAY